MATKRPSEMTFEELNMDQVELKAFLSKTLPKIPEKIDTFLDISGFPHYENVISNIYAYYFDKTKAHGFGDLFLIALFSAIQKKARSEFDGRVPHIDDWKEWSVRREESVQRKRIDIVIEETSQVEAQYVIIENKIFAHLDNPLGIYMAYPDNGSKIGIVLSLKEETLEHKDFVNVLHGELLNEIQLLQGQYTKGSERDMMILKDLIINIQQILSGDLANKKMIEFYHNNHKNIEEIVRLNNKVRKSFFKGVETLGGKIKSTVKFTGSSNYRCLVDSDNTDIYITFYLNDTSEGLEAPYFTIGLEVVGDLKDRRQKLMSGRELYDGHASNGILKSKSGNNSWIAEKYYTFKDIDFDFSRLEALYTNDWVPFVQDFKKLI